jgi:branched-chain amino acid transport system substrate-binding protein
MTLKKALTALVVTVALACAPAMAQKRAEATEIVVGQVIDSSPTRLEASRDYVAGAKTWFDHINSQGGVAGKRIRHVVLDGKGDPALAAKLTDELVNEYGASLLFGYVGEPALIGSANSAQWLRNPMPLVGPLTGQEAPAVVRDQVFFVRPSFASEARMVARYLAGFTIKNIAFAYQDVVGSRTIRESLVTATRDYGMLAPQEETLAQDSSDHAASAKRVFAKRPKAVVVSADSATTAGFMREYRKLDPGAFLIALSHVNTDVMLQVLGPQAVNGVIITRTTPHPKAENHAIVREHNRLMKVYRDEPSSHLTLEGFFAAKVAVQALAAKNISPNIALKSLRNREMGGMYIDYANGMRGSDFLDMAMIRRDGRLLQ